MVTVTEMKQNTLETPAAIADFLSADYLSMVETAPFAPGSVVTIVSRSSIPQGFAVGDVGVVVLCQVAPGPNAHVLMVNEGGARMVVQILTASLAARAAS